MKLNFTKQITTGRILVVLYLLLCSIIGYNIYPIVNLTNQSIERYDSIAAVSTRKLNLMNELRKNFNLIQSKVFRHLHSMSTIVMTEEEKEINKAYEENGAILEKYQKLIDSKEEQLLMNNILSLRKINVAARDKLLELSSLKKQDEAIAYYASTQEKTRINYSEAVEDLTDYVVKHTYVELSETEKYIKHKRISINLLIALSVLFAILTGIVVLYVNKKLNKQNAQLSEKNTMLQNVNSELDRFVYSTSHDLRSPLLSLEGLLNLSSEHIDSKSVVQQYHESMKGVIHQMDETIKEILDYSRAIEHTRNGPEY